MRNIVVTLTVDNTDNYGGNGSRKIMIMIKWNPEMVVRHSPALTALMPQPFSIMLKWSPGRVPKQS
jgi:hypothetical protein